MGIIPADRTRKITYAIRDVVVEAKRLESQGRKVIYLNIGDPLKYDFSVPQHMVDAINNNWRKSASYADSMGLLEARQAVARKSLKQGIKDVSEDDVIMTSGGSEGITMAIGALMNRGENVLTPKPGYPLYNAVINYLSGELNEYELDEENEWQPDIDDIRKRINSKTKGIVLINPNNPTGALYTKNTLKNVLDLAGEHNLPVLTDETYDEIIFDDDYKFNAVGSLADDVPVVTFSTLSKNYLCPGWRIGWSVFSGPQEKIKDYAEAVKQLARSRLSISHPMQYAVKPALEGPQDHIKEMVDKLRKRRDITYKRLNEIEGISCVKPKGAFYAFPRIDLPVESDKKFVFDLLREEGVLFVFGSGFGQKDNSKHFRVVFAASEDALSEAYEKLNNYIR
ncbi:aminotransferase class I/II-fold pyridoxal phosphate-dependent enzyme, partial [Candidatus Woesearchaeota archaeon]|nr:aminotransferase class I/II-fold pyridoxal phosphate-dependent enzyme [Candidatus Woesearchaeota archaeon]